MKKLSFFFAVCAALCLSATIGHAQGYKNGQVSVGVSLGLGAVTGSGLPISAYYDSGITDNISAGAFATYYGYSESFVGYSWKYTYLAFGAQGRYHLLLNEKNLDPYIGLMLGYNAGRVSYDGPSGFNSASPSYGGIIFGGIAGVRYFFSPSFAAEAQVGYGVAYLTLGASFLF
jgi:hypothetical protein